MIAHDYEPTIDDITWARLALEMVKNGGTLAMPATEMIWRVDHEKKLVVLVNPERLFSHVGQRTYLRIKAIFDKVGYVVAPS